VTGLQTGPYTVHDLVCLAIFYASTFFSMLGSSCYTAVLPFWAQDLWGWNEGPFTYFTFFGTAYVLLCTYTCAPIAQRYLRLPVACALANALSAAGCLSLPFLAQRLNPIRWAILVTACMAGYMGGSLTALGMPLVTGYARKSSVATVLAVNGVVNRGGQTLGTLAMVLFYTQWQSPNAVALFMATSQTIAALLLLLLAHIDGPSTPTKASAVANASLAEPLLHSDKSRQPGEAVTT